MEDNSNDKIAPLVREIQEAFANVPYPGDDNISAPTYDDEGTLEYFAGTKQEGHSVEDLRYHSAALSFFTLDAFLYYLPAYVVAVLQDPEEADIIYDSLIFHFNRAASGKIVHLLSPAQRQAMIKYFEYCLSEEGEYLDCNLAHALDILKTGRKP